MSIESEVLAKNLELSAKAPILIDRLQISSQAIMQIYEANRENLLNLKVNQVEVSRSDELLPNEAVELINHINPNVLKLATDK